MRVALTRALVSRPTVTAARSVSSSSSSSSSSSWLHVPSSTSMLPASSCASSLTTNNATTTTTTLSPAAQRWLRANGNSTTILNINGISETTDVVPPVAIAEDELLWYLPHAVPLHEQGNRIIEIEESVEEIGTANEIYCIKRTNQPKFGRRKRMHGFLSRNRTKDGRKILARQRIKGRWYLGPIVRKP